MMAPNGEGRIAKKIMRKMTLKCADIVFDCIGMATNYYNWEDSLLICALRESKIIMGI